jgi:hypothetical protein
MLLSVCSNHIIDHPSLVGNLLFLIELGQADLEKEVPGV